MKNIINKGLFALIVAVLAAAACKKDDSCSVSFPTNAIYVQEWNESITATFSTSNVASVSVSATNGWSASADLATRTVIITAPESEEADNADKNSTITLSAKSPGGATSSATLYAYLVPETIDLSAEGSANCYIVTQADTRYKFSTARKGEEGELLATESVSIVWQSSAALIRYLKLDDDGYAEFYISHSDDETLLNEGNALIAAHNAKGDIIWSWHLWITNSDPRTEEGVSTYSTGAVFMGRNLGSFGNSDGSTDTDEILASYGLYYQWGRKDPFPRPRYYNCANNIDQPLYNAASGFVYTTLTETDAEHGTVAYTVANPTVFLTSPAGNEGDWLYGSRDDSLWGDGSGSGKKSLYDPCPKGWKVPASADFASLELADEDDNMDLDLAKKSYGWFLTDKDGSRYFYLGGGYRSYFDGILSNVNYKDQYPYTPVPWVGYYWTQGTDGSDGAAMFFDLNTSRATINAFEPYMPQYRANAMQIRCVRAAR